MSRLRRQVRCSVTSGPFAVVQSSEGTVLVSDFVWPVTDPLSEHRKSHATYPYLQAPTPPTFNLDFAQLLQATAANPSRARIRGAAIVGRVKSGVSREKIVEEEDGWDLVDMDGLR